MFGKEISSFRGHTRELEQGRGRAQTPEIQRCDCREEGENNGLKVEVRSKRNICPAYQVPWSKGVVKERATL